jgi:DNA recombination protein RmuC
MDPMVLFLLSIFVTVALFGFLIYFISLQFKKLESQKPDDKKDEMLNQFLQGMQSNLNERLTGVQGTMDERLKHVTDQLLSTTDVLNKRVDESSKGMNVRLDNAAKVIGDVQRELGSMSEIGRGMKDLQDFLKSPKLRGNIGEEVLKDLLQQMLPADHYVLQFTFKTGDRVDAILKVNDGLLCVDSKFPMENFSAMMQAETADDREISRKEFNRNVKKHIDDISKKYILPGEGTLDFALMYIPSEAIYYEVVVNAEDLGKYAWNKRVLPVSPNVFFSYLKAIKIGLEGKRIESRAKEILVALRSIKEDSGKFNESLRVMTKHINNAKNSAEEVTKNYEKIDNRIGSLNQIGELATDIKETTELIAEAPAEEMDRLI